MRTLQSVFFLYLAISVGCSERSGQEKHASDKNDTTLIQNTLSGQSANGFIDSTDVCYDSLAQLLTTSNFLVASGFAGSQWSKKWQENGRFTIEFDNQGKLLIHVYFKPEPEIGQKTI